MEGSGAELEQPGLSADAQRDDGGVVDGDDAGAGKGPAGVFRRALVCGVAAWWSV